MPLLFLIYISLGFIAIHQSHPAHGIMDFQLLVGTDFLCHSWHPDVQKILSCKDLHIENGFTQDRTADALNIDQSYYRRIETGRRGFSVDLFMQLSDLNVSLDYLVLGGFRNRLPKEANTGHLKSEIESLVVQLKWFKISRGYHS